MLDTRAKALQKELRADLGQWIRRRSKHLERVETTETLSEASNCTVQNEEKGPAIPTELESEEGGIASSGVENSQQEKSIGPCSEAKPTVSYNEEYKSSSSDLPPIDWPKIIEAVEILWDPSYTPKQTAPDAYDGFINT